MAVQIRLAQTTDDLLAVCRFRYGIYAEEMKLNPEEADHAYRAIGDPLDASGHVFMAIEEDRQVVGTVRVNFAFESDLGADIARFQMERFGPYFPRHVSMSTRLMVSRKYRNGTLGARLAKACNKLTYDAGIRFDNICCHARQLGFMKRMGYRQIAPNFHLEGFGESHPLVLVIADKRHLLDVGSPFAAQLPQVPEDFGSVKFFNEHLLDQPYALSA
jgi:hypothetical protein